MGLSLALFHAEQLDPWTREELQQLIASLQAQLGQPSPVATTRIQRVVVTYASGATSASASIPLPVDLSQTEFTLLGEEIPTNGAFGSVNNLSRLDLDTTTSTTVGIKRQAGNNQSSTNITGSVTVQIVERRSGSI